MCMVQGDVKGQRHVTIRPPSLPELDGLKSLVSSLSPPILGDKGTYTARAAVNVSIFRTVLE